MAVVFETTDAGVAHALLREHYTTLRLSTVGERVGLRIDQDRLGPVRLDRVSFAMSAEIDGDPLGSLCIGRVRAGRITYRHPGDEVVCRPGDVVLAAQPDSAWSARLDDLDADFAFIDPRLLADVARTDGGAPARLVGHTPVSPKAARLWWRTFSYVHTVATNPATAGNDLVTGAAARLLTATALAVFPHAELLDPAAGDRHDAHPETLRRAIAFIEANPHRDIGIADIADAAYVSVRAVQLAFRRHLDTTPMAYLRRVRLRLAHRELLDADPATSSVTAVAARWGFLNPSHFATL
jgi:AraC-like DNA-binding protein